MLGKSIKLAQVGYTKEVGQQNEAIRDPTERKKKKEEEARRWILKRETSIWKNVLERQRGSINKSPEFNFTLSIS